MSNRFLVLALTISAFLGAPALAPTQETAHAERPRVARISGGVMAGNLLTKVDPIYPPEARDAHVSGTIVLHAIIASDGTVKQLTVVSGPQLLQGAAVDAVRQWTYRPYLLNGAPIEVDTAITVNFNLQ